MDENLYRSKEIADFYNYNAQYGAACNDLAETQYGEKDGRVIDPTRNFFFRKKFIEYISEIIPEDAILLDVGCGNGYLAKAIFPKVRRYIGIDISIERIKQCRLSLKNFNVFFIVADAGFLPFKDGVFSYIVALEVIEHLRSPNIFFKGARKILSHRGELVLSTPNNFIYKDKRDLLLHNQHIFEFSIGWLKGLIKKHGLMISEIRGIGFRLPRITVPLWMGSDVIKYFYNSIKKIPLKSGYGQPITIDLDAISNPMLNKMCFNRHTRGLAYMLMTAFFHISRLCYFFGSNLIIVCRK